MIPARYFTASLCLISASMLGQEADVAVPGADSKSLPAYELKNRSAFEIDPEARTPFWPIGWKKSNRAFAPAVRTPQQPVKTFLIQPQDFTLTSILLGNPPLATINGRAFGEGEALPVVVGNQPVRVIVKAIRDGGVWLDQSGHTIFVPMRRQEIPTRAPEAPQQEKTFVIPIQPR